MSDQIKSVTTFSWYTVRQSLRESWVNADLWHFNLLWVYNVVYKKGRRRERDFVYRCNCYQNMPPFAHVKSTALLLYRNYNAARPVLILWLINMCPKTSASCITLSYCPVWIHPYSCPCSLCSLYYKDMDGCRTISQIAHIPQFSTHVRPYLHLACGNIHISTWTYTQKHKHNHVYKYLLIWLVCPFDKVGWSRMKIEHVRFSYNIVGWCRVVFYGVIHDQTSADFVVSNMSYATYRTVYHRLKTRKNAYAKVVLCNHKINAPSVTLVFPTIPL